LIFFTKTIVQNTCYQHNTYHLCVSVGYQCIKLNIYIYIVRVHKAYLQVKYKININKLANAKPYKNIMHYFVYIKLFYYYACMFPLI